MSTLLIEIGSEELPAKLVEPAIKHLLSNFTQVLSKEGIEFSEPEAFATPRRLALLFKEIKTQAPSRDQEEKGPPKSTCFDKDGKPTKALEGFAIKVGKKVEDVEFKEIGSGIYATSARSIQGKTLSDIVAIELPKIVLSFPHPHSMRWDETGISWVRPIRWIVALQDDKILPIVIGKIKSDRFTRSPRPERIKKFEIQKPSDYQNILDGMGIIGNIEKRKEFINLEANNLAKDLGLHAYQDDNLLNELSTIVERPIVVQGEFDENYLKATPELVVKTVLISDLRFIPFVTTDGLTNKFALVVNGPVDIGEAVKNGELKVLNGRLSDAKFFYAEDRKHKLEDFIPKLSGIAFVKGLGTLKDKADRMINIAKDLTPILNERMKGFNEKILLRACELAKADLATSMVQEHDTLQGEIGGFYAQLDGEDTYVVRAIEQHYLPQGDSDSLPGNLYGQIVAIIDKADSLTNIISLGNIPKGSADPLGVRRLAFGLLKLLIMNDVSINLSEILNICSKYLVRPSPDSMVNTMNFLSERLEGYLRANNFKYDIVRASMTSETDDLKLLLAKIEVIQKEYNTFEFSGVVATFKRLNNILKNYKSIGSYDRNLFRDENEKQFEEKCIDAFKEIIDISIKNKGSRDEKISNEEFNKFKHISAVNKPIRLFVLENNLKNQFQILEELTEYAEKYFDNVMVNVEDEAIRSNRKNFLSWLLGQYLSVADFTQIAI